MLEANEPEIIVVDDASPDGSGSDLERDSGRLNFTLVSNALNLGFGPTVNRGASLASGEFIAVSNTDIEFTEEAPAHVVLERLASALGDQSIGAAMPCVYKTSPAFLGVENLNEIWASRGLLWLRRLPKAKDLSAAGETPSEPGDASVLKTVLCGAFFVMRRRDFQQLGGFDPVYTPYYLEDVELGARIEAGGRSVVLCRDITILHRHNLSISERDEAGRQRNHYQRNQLTFTRAWGREYGVKSPRIWHFLRALRSFVKGEFRLGMNYLGK